MQGGILDRSSPTYEKERRQANKRGLPYRVRGVSWWEQELPSAEEMQEGRDNLSRHGYVVDYVITHCLSGRMQGRLDVVRSVSKGGDSARDILTDYFDEIEEKLKYEHWFCGHYHENIRLDEKHTVIYEDILALQ